ncbi:MAG: hypothetical protein AAGA31_20345, partial [Bacteroidota bacterium]
MKQKVTAKLAGRPVFIADYRSPLARPSSLLEEPEAHARPLTTSKKGIRYNFPVSGEKQEGGVSDGYCYRITFATGQLENTYALVKAFLQE